MSISKNSFPDGADRHVIMAFCVLVRSGGARGNCRLQSADAFRHVFYSAQIHDTVRNSHLDAGQS